MTQRLFDEGQHAFQIAINFIVPETQYAEALADKMVVALRVTSGMAIQVMLAAIDLDDKALLETDEIYDIVSTRRLAAEMESLFSPSTQMNPQFYLLRGHTFAEAASDFVRHGLPHPTSLRSATLPLGGRDCSCTRPLTAELKPRILADAENTSRIWLRFVLPKCWLAVVAYRFSLCGRCGLLFSVSFVKTDNLHEKAFPTRSDRWAWDLGILRRLTPRARVRSVNVNQAVQAPGSFCERVNCTRMLGARELFRGSWTSVCC